MNIQIAAASRTSFRPVSTPDEVVPDGYANPYAPTFQYVEAESNYFIEYGPWQSDSGDVYSSHNGSQRAGRAIIGASNPLAYSYVEVMARKVGLLYPTTPNIYGVRMRITRVSTNVVVYDETASQHSNDRIASGYPDGDTPQLLADLSVFARYKVEIIQVDNTFVNDCIRLYE